MSPQTKLLEPPVAVPDEHLPWVTAFLAACRFTFATQGDLGGRPVVESPHGYVRRDSLPESTRVDFDRFVTLIDEHGYRGRFLGTLYTYLDVGEHRYWQSPSFFPPVTVMLNRASDLAVPPPPPELRLWPQEPTP